MRRILAKNYQPKLGSTQGPSWLSLLGHRKDSLWSIDLFRCESITLQSHWALVVMDQWSRRIKSVRYVPMSHHFIERVIGTIRREYLDHVPFWNSLDLARKLDDFKR